MGDKHYYIRVRGRILGPFGLSQLKRQRDRGQLSRFHEVSEDRRTWVSAATLEELFPSEEAPGEGQLPSTLVTVAPIPVPPGAAGDAGPSAPCWYYLDRGKEVGPVTRDALLGLLDERVIEPQTLVWNPSMPEWVPLESVSGLTGGPATGLTKRTGALSRLALASFISALVWAGGLASTAAVVLGVLALRQLRRRGGKTRGRWMAVTGLSVGAAGVVLTPLAGLLLYFALREPATLTPEQISDRYKDRVYIIKTTKIIMTKGGMGVKKSTGSGILIANSKTRGLIATNLHVYDNELESDPAKRRWMDKNAIEKDEIAEVKNPSQVVTRKARWAAIHRYNDLALLVLEMENAPAQGVPVIRKHRLHDGEAAVALGYPFGLDYKVSPGAISGTSGELGAVWTTCPISPGNSGGPLFLERRGLLAGLNTFGVAKQHAQNLNGAEPAEEIATSLQGGHTDKWIWAPDLKNDVIELAKQIPVVD